MVRGKGQIVSDVTLNITTPLIPVPSSRLLTFHTSTTFPSAFALSESFPLSSGGAHGKDGGQSRDALHLPPAAHSLPPFAPRYAPPHTEF